MEMLGAITGLIGAGLSASAQGSQQAIAWAQLQFQKEQARRQERFAQAARTDAYGNEQYYDYAANKWVTKLTPVQKQITTAGEQEQLRSLTEDAQRNRRQKQRAEQTALQAGEEYQKTLAGYKYDQPHSQQADEDKLQQLMIGGNRQRMKDDQGLLIRQALRLGRGGDVEKIIKSTDDQLGQMQPDLMLAALKDSRMMAAQDAQQHQSLYLPALKQWSDLMSQGGGDAVQRFSSTPQDMMAVQGQQVNAMLSALKSGSEGVSGAYKALGDAAGKSPDLSGVGKALSGLGKAAGTGQAKYSLTGKGNAGTGSVSDADGWWTYPGANDPGGYMDNIDFGNILSNPSYNFGGVTDFGDYLS